MEPIVDPESFASIGDDTPFAQVGEVAGDFRLGFVEGLGELANTQFAFALKQQQAAQANIASEGGEKLIGGYMHET